MARCIPRPSHFPPFLSLQYSTLAAYPYTLISSSSSSSLRADPTSSSSSSFLLSSSARRPERRRKTTTTTTTTTTPRSTTKFFFSYTVLPPVSPPCSRPFQHSHRPRVAPHAQIFHLEDQLAPSPPHRLLAIFFFLLWLRTPDETPMEFHRTLDLSLSLSLFLLLDWQLLPATLLSKTDSEILRERSAWWIDRSSTLLSSRFELIESKNWLEK